MMKTMAMVVSACACWYVSLASADMPVSDIDFLSVQCQPQSYWNRIPKVAAYVLAQDVCAPLPRPDPRKKVIRHG